MSTINQIVSSYFKDFQYNTPVVSGFAPSSENTSNSVLVTIGGSNFVGATSVNLNDPNNTPLQSVNVTSNNEIIAIVPSGIFPGSYDIQVHNPDAMNITSSEKFNVIANATVVPQIISCPSSIVVPKSGSTTQQFTVSDLDSASVNFSFDISNQYFSTYFNFVTSTSGSVVINTVTKVGSYSFTISGKGLTRSTKVPIILTITDAQNNSVSKTINLYAF